MSRIEPRVRRSIEQLASMGGFRERNPDDPAPMLDDAARVWTINVEAQISNGWRWPREIAWHQVAAWRAEDVDGNALEDEAELELEELDGDEHAEPSSYVEDE